MSAAVPSGSRWRPGSPWMPMPISISVSPSSKVGLPAAGTVHDVSAMPMLRPHPFTLRPIAATVARSAPSSAAAPQIFSTRTVTPTPRRPAVYRLSCDGDVVVGDDGSTFTPAVLGGHLGGHLEVHDVACVVLDDVQHAGAPVDELGRFVHLVGRRRREDLARARGVEHAETDEAAVERLVPGPAAGDQPDLAGDRCGRSAMILRSMSTRSPGWAAARPASASWTTADGSLISFFMTFLLGRSRRRQAAVSASE